MEEVIDYTHATSSPEELAIHFLLRHAECRKALTGQTGEERLQLALERSRPDAPAVQSSGVYSGRSGESLPSSTPPSGGVTENDSWAARFSRAYAAARHVSAGADAPRMARMA